MGAGGFPIDLVLFAMIAAFLVLRLRSILGRRQGFERPAAPAVARVADRIVPPPVPSQRALPDPDTPVGRTLAQMGQVDARFQAARFLDGAEAAFRLIVTGFAAGDRVALRPLLDDETYRSFEQAIAAREAAGETQRTELRAVTGQIEEASLTGTVGTVQVRFVSDQINLTLGSAGQTVTGTDAVTEIVDLWTFERDLASNDPAWRLTAARSA